MRADSVPRAHLPRLPGARTLLLLLLALAFVAQCVHIARESSLANDETKHLATGWWLLHAGRCCLGIDNSPLTAWSALPLLWLGVAEPAPGAVPADAHAAGRELIFDSPDPEAVILASRLMSIAAGVMLLFAAAVLADRLFKPPAGLIAAGVLAFEPNVLAHFSLVSTDALFVLTAVAFVLAFDDALVKPSRRAAVVLGGAFGLALVAKLSAFALAPASVGLLVLYRAQLQTRPARWWIESAALALGAAIVVVWVAYGAHASVDPPFLSIPGLIAGLAQVKAVSASGFMSYYLGEPGRHWPSYFLGCLAFKTPVAELLLWLVVIVLAPVCAVRSGFGRRLVPIAMAGFFLAVGLASNLNLGVRHILPVYAFAAVAVGALAGWKPRWLPRGGVVGILACAVLGIAIESLRIAPHAVSYFNPLAGGPMGGLRYLGDSNLDWGQDLKMLKRVMIREQIDEVILSYLGTTDPAFYGIEYQYLPHMFYGSTNGDHVVDARREVLAVSTNNLQGIVSRRADFGWLREREPFATAGYSIYLYDITGDAEAHAHLASIYARYELSALAAKERMKVAALRARDKD